MGEHKHHARVLAERSWALSAILAHLTTDEITRVAGQLSGADAGRLESAVRGFAPDLEARDTGKRPAPLDARDGARLDWCLNRSAQLFRRETPERAVMLAYFPLKQDGFIAGEVEGRDVPVHTQSVVLSRFGGDASEAARFLIDLEMRGPDSRASSSESGT